MYEDARGEDIESQNTVDKDATDGLVLMLTFYPIVDLDRLTLT